MEYASFHQPIGEKVDLVESLTGDISGEYTCTWKNCSGTLYAGNKAVYFSGTFFLFDRNVLLRWDEIRQVQKTHQGVEIICSDETVHTFHGITSPERLWVILVTLHNDALLDRKGKPRVYVKRRNSDPWNTALLDGLHVDTSDGASDTEAPVAATPLENSGANENTQPKHASFKDSEVGKIIGAIKLHPLSCKFEDIPGKLFTGEDALYFSGKRFLWEKKTILMKWEDLKQVQIISLTDMNGKRGTGIAGEGGKADGIQIVTKADLCYRFYGIATADKVWAVLMSVHNESLARKPRRTPTRGVRRNNSDPLMASQQNLDFETTDGNGVERSGQSADVEAPRATLEEEWKTVAEESKYQNVVVKDHVLKTDLDSFIDLFLKDDAKFSIGRYLESRGDSNLQESPWKTAGDGNKRVVTYSHPVNVPMAPPKADARKEQTYQRYGNYGLCIKTTTHVDDVPMADCFYVADCIRVQPSGENSVSVSMEFQITFVKSTMFKAIITKTAEKEVFASIGEMANYMTDAIGNGDAPPVPKSTQRPVVKVPIAPIPPPTSGAVLVLVAAVAVLQVWAIVEMRGVKSILRTVLARDGQMTCVE